MALRPPRRLRSPATPSLEPGMRAGGSEIPGTATGRSAMRARSDATVTVAGVSVRDAVIRFRFGVPQLADGGGLSVAAIFRGSSTGNQYQVRVRVAGDRYV